MVMTVENIFCPHCGKETSGSGIFCAWCGETIHNENNANPVVLKKPTSKQAQDDNISGWAIVLLFFFLVGIVGVMIFLTQHGSTVVTITVTEKYPAHTYTAWCGKTQCELHNLPSVVDERGVVYDVANPQLWGSLRINGTYPVRYYTSSATNSGNGKVIDGATIDGVTYTVRGI